MYMVGQTTGSQYLDQTLLAYLVILMVCLAIIILIIRGRR